MVRCLFLLLLAAFAVAEQEYFTWVDAQGRIHNSPVERKPDNISSSAAIDSSPEQATLSSEQAASSAVTNAGIPLPDDAALGVKASGESYLTEEQIQQKLEQEKKDNPPFYTYVDEQGQVKNQTIVDANIEVEEVVTTSYDHILAPPFRVTELMAKGCCRRYQSYFKEQIPEQKSVLFSGFLNTVPILTRFGGKKAWYFSLKDSPDVRVLLLKLRTQASSWPEMSVIFTDKQFNALYFLPQLSFVETQASWSGQASADSMIKIEDNKVSSVVVYFADAPPASTSLEVSWWRGSLSN